jgi:hypothetical protein
MKADERRGAKGEAHRGEEPPGISPVDHGGLRRGEALSPFSLENFVTTPSLILQKGHTCIPKSKKQLCNSIDQKLQPNLSHSIWEVA